MLKGLKETDPEIEEIIFKEILRQKMTIELVASENFAPFSVMNACGSVLTNKYAEGYPNKRYYGGCHEIDKIEQIAIDRARELFNCNYANVQPHSGSNANLATYHALCDIGDTIMGLSLDNGGHLTHGCTVSFSGIYYHAIPYYLNPETELLDYDSILNKAKQCNPKVIVAGYSAYPRFIDFKKMREIADEVDAYLIVDMAHIAGLIAAGIHPSPFPYAHVVTSTTQKTLRGPRGGIILTNDKELAEKIDKAIFPGTQGGPLMNTIAGKAVAFKIASTEGYKDYMNRVIKNAKVMAESIEKEGLRLVSGGTDTHLFLVDVTPAELTGQEAEEILDNVGITVNKNTIPNETKSPFVTSGIRIGTPAITTRGFTEADCASLGKNIGKLLFHPNEPHLIQFIKRENIKLCEKYPLYTE